MDPIPNYAKTHLSALENPQLHRIRNPNFASKFERGKSDLAWHRPFDPA